MVRYKAQLGGTGTASSCVVEVRRFQDSWATEMVKYVSFRSNFTMNPPLTDDACQHVQALHLEVRWYYMGVNVSLRSIISSATFEDDKDRADYMNF